MFAQERDRPPPLPERVSLAGTVRDLGSVEIPVAELEFVDVLGERWAVQLTPRLMMSLLAQGARFLQQVVEFDA